MRLSEREKAILCVSEHNAQLTLAELSELSGYRPHVLRYHLKKLYESQIIHLRRPFIQLPKLGFTIYTLYFSLASENAASKQKMLDKLTRSPSVIWVLELGGDYQYGVCICVRHLTEIVRLISKISLRFGNPFFQKSMAIRISYTQYGRRYLQEDSHTVPLRFSALDGSEEIDDVDEKLLGTMANGEYNSDRQLSRLTGIPQTTLERRKKKLEERGIISGYYFRVFPERFGIQQYKLLVYLKGVNPRLTKALSEFTLEARQVIYFVECMGSWDYEIGIETDQASHVTQFTEMLYKTFGRDIAMIKVLPVFRFLKFKSYPAYQEGSS